MPGDIYREGENPFYVGYKGDSFSLSTRFPLMHMENPMNDIPSIVKEFYPNPSPYLRDWIEKELIQNGISEKAGQEGFAEEVRTFLKDFKRKVAKVAALHNK